MLIRVEKVDGAVVIAFKIDSEPILDLRHIIN